MCTDETKHVHSISQYLLIPFFRTRSAYLSVPHMRTTIDDFHILRRIRHCNINNRNINSVWFIHSAWKKRTANKSKLSCYESGSTSVHISCGAYARTHTMTYQWPFTIFKYPLKTTYFRIFSWNHVL